MIIPCPSCKELIRFNEQERHNERECPERTLNCKYCKEPFHFKNIKVKYIACFWNAMTYRNRNVDCNTLVFKHSCN
uniref:TRAF-type domain-containing protein n=1 Tax=Anguilla anguilla TaxID=7936 RepID=A0A0E9T8F0_ANGAN